MNEKLQEEEEKKRRSAARAATAPTTVPDSYKIGAGPTVSRPDFLGLFTSPCTDNNDVIQEESKDSTNCRDSQPSILEDNAIFLQEMENSQRICAMSNEDILLDAGYDENIPRLTTMTLPANLDPDLGKVKVSGGIDQDGMLLDDGAHNIRRSSDTLSSSLSSSCSLTSKWSESTHAAIKRPQLERKWSLDHHLLVTQNWATFKEDDTGNVAQGHSSFYQSSPRSTSMLEHFSSSPGDSSLRECWAYPRARMSSSEHFLHGQTHSDSHSDHSGSHGDMKSQSHSDSHGDMKSQSHSDGIIDVNIYNESHTCSGIYDDMNSQIGIDSQNRDSHSDSHIQIQAHDDLIKSDSLSLNTPSESKDEILNKVHQGGDNDFQPPQGKYFDSDQNHDQGFTYTSGVREEIISIESLDNIDENTPTSQQPDSSELCVDGNDKEIMRKEPGITSIVSDITPFGAHKPITISDLPVEVMQHILSYLSPTDLCRYVSPVCQRWHAFSRDLTLWKVLQLEYSDQISTESLCICFQHASLLRHLSLHGRKELNYAEVRALSDSCKHLQTINLGFCDSVNYGIIATLVKGCRELEVVNVEGCNALDHRCIEKLCELPALCSVNLSHCIHLQDESVEHMAKHINKLFSLNIDGISMITDQAISVLVSHQGQHLRQLFLDGAELSDESLVEVSKCKFLEKFSISFAELITDVGVQHLKKLDCLRSLKLKKGEQLTNDGMKCLFGGEGLSGLHSLDLNGCSELEDAGVQQLVQCCGSSLEYLGLCWCWNITDAGLSSIVDKCRNLRRLELVGVKVIRGGCLAQVPVKIPNLVYLDLKSCNGIEDELIEDVIKKKPDLVAVNYYGEVFIADDNRDQAFITVMKKMPDNLQIDKLPYL